MRAPRTFMLGSGSAAAIFCHMARGQRCPPEAIERWVEQWWASDLTSDDFVVQHALPISARALRDHGDRHFKSILVELNQLRALALVRKSPSGEMVPVTSACTAPVVAIAKAEACQLNLPAGASCQMARPADSFAQPDFFSFDLDLE